MSTAYTLSLAGAQEIAAKIEAYWHRRGELHVKTYIEPIERTDKGSPGYGVRSNLMCGLPPRVLL